MDGNAYVTWVGCPRKLGRQLARVVRPVAVVEPVEFPGQLVRHANEIGAEVEEPRIVNVAVCHKAARRPATGSSSWSQGHQPDSERPGRTTSTSSLRTTNGNSGACVATAPLATATYLYMGSNNPVGADGSCAGAQGKGYTYTDTPNQICGDGNWGKTQMEVWFQAPPPPSPPAPPVDCSVKGNCFNISGAHNYNWLGKMANDTDLNGQYTKTIQVCERKPVYKNGGLLLWHGDHANPSEPLQWNVGPATVFAVDCDQRNGLYLWSNGGCPDSPDGSGCVGQWLEAERHA